MSAPAKTVAGLAGVDNIKPHSIRQAAATRLMQSGPDLRSVMASLGHSHLQTTVIYLRTNDARLQQIASLASIRLDSHGQEPRAISAVAAQLGRKIRQPLARVRRTRTVK